jgi:spermidine synthase
MTLGWAANDAALASVGVEQIRERAAASGILGTTRYWTPQIHVGAFNLPPYIALHLPVDQ